MTRAKSRGLVIWALGLALLSAALVWPQLRLELWDQENRRPLLSLALPAGAGFSLEFFHSYDRAPCQEHYSLRGAGRLVLERLVTRTALNGQGFVEGDYRPLPGGWAELGGINQPMPEMTFRLGSPDLANHQLLVAGRQFVLNRFAPPGTLLTLTGCWRPWWWQPAGQNLASRTEALKHKEHLS